MEREEERKSRPLLPLSLWDLAKNSAAAFGIVLCTINLLHSLTPRFLLLLSLYCADAQKTPAEAQKRRVTQKVLNQPSLCLLNGPSSDTRRFYIF